MISIIIPSSENWDEVNQQFISTKEQHLRLEHSLVSISKWESKWHKPFFSNEDKTDEEIIDYVRCMTLTQNVAPDIYWHLTKENMDAIGKYIEDPMTATTFKKNAMHGSNGEGVTSELIYYWMIALGIPFECQKWNINRLFTLIKICNIKSQPSKKMSQRELMSRNAALNAARRKKLNSRG